MIGARSHGATGYGVRRTKTASAHGAAPPLTAIGGVPLRLRAGSKAGEKGQDGDSLEYAAEKGHPRRSGNLAACMPKAMASPQDDLRAFHYFRRIANSHADDNPDTPQSRFVANAFVALGHYYLNGIPKTDDQARSGSRARNVRLCGVLFPRCRCAILSRRGSISTAGAPRDPRQAARWFGLSAQKGQCQAQAMLGDMLFAGDHVPRQAARGLMWLALWQGLRRPAPDRRTGSSRLYDSAFRPASEDERAMALVYLKRWMKTRRE